MPLRSAKPVAALLVLFTVAAGRAASTGAYDTSVSAWQRGDYVSALNGFIQVLNAPDGGAYLDRIALKTGELYRSFELTGDGRAGRFSPDGRYILYETGLETSRGTRVLRNDATRAVVVELPGISATFTPDGSKVAYLRVNDTEDVRSAAQQLAAATLTQSTRNALVNTLAWLIARDSTIVVHDMASGRDAEVLAPGLIKSSLRYGGDGRTLYFLGAREGDAARNDIFTVVEGGIAPALAIDAGGFKSPPLVDPSGASLVYAIPNVNPLARPPAPGAVVQNPRTPPPSTFAIVDLTSRSVSVVTGTAPALSGDGRTLAYVARGGANGSEYHLMVGPTLGLQSPVRKTLERVDAPALSDDGRRLAWQMMPRDDWEIFVADVDGTSLKGERRITRDIQHDVLPRFLGPDRLLALVGEPRHRRSYLYDLSSATPAADRVDKGIRLFHNNTVRTIAPEYQWAPSPDGTKLIIGAERDGDTVGPPRGVYLVDLAQTITKTDLLARLRDNLRSETALKAAAARAFLPIAAEVRRVVSEASVDRVFGYEQALFGFDSKHITQPGNARASEYLFKTYASFGYAPEYQWFEPRNALGGRSANVVATLKGTVNPELVYVISSHYDSVEAGPGADDDSSGTAALLEAARVLAGHPLPATVMFVSVTGEEAGLLGSREFVRRALERKLHVAGVLNNDMIGWTNDERMDNTIRYSNAGIRDIQHAAAMQFTKLITYDALYWKNTDAMSFYDAYGDIIGGIGSYPVLSSPYYHQATDLLQNENHQLITETSKTTVASIMLMASSPSRLTNLKIDSYTNGVAALSWTPSPEKGVTSYVVSYGPKQAPSASRITVTQPKATLPQAPPGTVISVKAVNARGLESWDAARITLEARPVRRSSAGEQAIGDSPSGARPW